MVEVPAPVKNVFAFDSIRMFKLMEITQYMILAVIISLVVSSWIDTWFTPPENIHEKHAHEILLHMLAELLVLGVTLYYIKKVIQMIPFVMIPIVRAVGSGYVPNKKNEANVGIAVGVALVFTKTLVNLNTKIIAFRDTFGK